MELQLRFFASIREHIGTAELCHSFAGEGVSVAALVQSLEKGPLPGCARWLLADNTIIAVNRVVAHPDQTLCDGDEVAFYPPVTGG